MTTDEKNLILKMRKENKSYKEIAEATGKSRSSIISIILREEKKPDNKCLFCGKNVVQTKGHRQKSFCDSKCRMKYWLANGCSNKKIHKCKKCGKEFYGYESQHPSFCSKNCFYNYRRGHADDIK